MGALLSGFDEKRIPVNVDAGGSGKWVEYTLMAGQARTERGPTTMTAF